MGGKGPALGSWWRKNKGGQFGRAPRRGPCTPGLLDGVYLQRPCPPITYLGDYLGR